MTKINKLIIQMTELAEEILELEADGHKGDDLIHLYDRADTVFSAGNIKALLQNNEALIATIEMQDQKIQKQELKLAELGKQEPVAWRCDGERGLQIFTEKLPSDKSWKITELFSRPVPQAVSQPGKVGMKVCDACLDVLCALGFDPKKARLSDVLAKIDGLNSQASQPYTVPDETQLRELFELWAAENRINLTRNHKFQNNYEFKRAIQNWHIWKSCRAAMLQSSNTVWIGIDWAKGE
ncbi:hypothetical protein ACIPSD_20755 [Pectobacterium sp. CHL-2024]|uniref:hypothetical protein n=1 Tax=Pectobacterium sp. CHL-2024 TaxID=3377079 RepID=UPI0038204247